MVRGGGMIEILFSCCFAVLVGMVGYLLYYTQALVRRTDTQTTRLVDALLALVNKQAAMTAVNMQRVRHTIETTPPPTPQDRDAQRKRIENDIMLEEINRATVLTPEQEDFLTKYEQNGNRV